MPQTGDPLRRARIILLVMSFFCLFVLSVQRINMSMAIVCMANWTAIEGKYTHLCEINSTADHKSQDGPFKWSPRMHAQILASYFYGLAVSHIPAELLVENFRPRWVVLVGTAIATICNFASPAAAAWTPYALIYVQVTKAIGQAFVMPAIGVMIGRWVPKSQLVRFVAYATCGLPVGAFCTMLATGLICEDAAHEWQSVFYYSGAIGVVWCLLWLYFQCDTTFIPILITNSQRRGSQEEKHVPVPLRQILASRPVWAYILVGIASYWAASINILVLPTYLKTAFELDVNWISLVSSFPHALQAFTFMFTFLLSDRILDRRDATKTKVRRLAVCTGLSIFATCMVLLTFARCRRAVAILLLVVSLGCTGFNLAALASIPIDMSPRFTGILSGMMNAVGAAVGSVLPNIVGYLTEVESGVHEWDKVFYSSTFITIISLILYMAFGSSRLQPWNDPLARASSIMLADLTESQTPIVRRTPSEESKEKEEDDETTKHAEEPFSNDSRKVSYNSRKPSHDSRKNSNESRNISTYSRTISSSKKDSREFKPKICIPDF